MGLEAKQNSYSIGFFFRAGIRYSPPIPQTAGSPENGGPWETRRFLLETIISRFHVTHPKFNSSPLKDGGWKMILSYWVSAYFQGRTVKLRGGNFGGCIIQNGWGSLNSHSQGVPIRTEDHSTPGRWRPVSGERLGSPPAIWKGSHNSILRGLTITMVVNHLRVLGWSSKSTITVVEKNPRYPNTCWGLVFDWYVFLGSSHTFLGGGPGCLVFQSPFFQNWSCLTRQNLGPLLKVKLLVGYM